MGSTFAFLDMDPFTIGIVAYTAHLLILPTLCDPGPGDPWAKGTPNTIAAEYFPPATGYCTSCNVHNGRPLEHMRNVHPGMTGEHPLA